MIDVQRERLKHLLVNAILELWKKETGSLTSVIIEGTVCITSSGGKTTVVQVSDKFQGAIPSVEDLGPGFGFHGDSDTVYNYTQCSDIDRATRNGAQHIDITEMSPVSLVSPNSEASGFSHSSGESLTLVRGNKRKSHEDTSEGSIKQEGSNYDSCPQLKRQNSRSSEKRSSWGSKSQDEENRSFGNVMPGTGYYTPAGSNETDLNANNSNNDSVVSEKRNLETASVSTPVSDKEHVLHKNNGDMTLSPENYHPENGKDAAQGEANGLSNGLDLRKRDSDLAVSHPQDYTQQVRNVIRQRLLAARSMSVGNESDTGSPIPERYSESPFLQSHYRGSQEELKVSTSPVSDDPREKWASVPINGYHPHYPHPASASIVTSASDLSVASVASRMYSPISGMTGVHAPFSAIVNKAHITPLNGPVQVMEKGAQISVLKPNMMGSGFRAHEKKLLSPGYAPSNVSLSPVGSESNQSSFDKDGSMDKEENSPGSKGEPQHVYKCDFCSKTFLFKSKYHEHLPVHTNARPFQCHLCSRTYKYKYDLRVHLRTHMGIPTKSTVCPFCTIKFETNKMLRLHIKDSHRDKQKATEEECTDPREHLPPAL